MCLLAVSGSDYSAKSFCTALLEIQFSAKPNRSVPFALSLSYLCGLLRTRNTRRRIRSSRSSRRAKSEQQEEKH